jgi:hypothetical protein
MVASCRSGGPEGRRSTTTVPRRRHPLPVPTTAPTHVLQPARPRRAGPLPSSGASVAGQGWQSAQRGLAWACRPQRSPQRHPRNQPGCTCNPGTSVWIKHRSPLHEGGAPSLVAARERRRQQGFGRVKVHHVRVSAGGGSCHQDRCERSEGMGRPTAAPIIPAGLLLALPARTRSRRRTPATLVDARNMQRPLGVSGGLCMFL